MFPQPVNFGTMVIVEDIQNARGLFPTLLVKTEVHELGHLLGAGRNDDGRTLGVATDEVYSGGGNDDTPEEVGFAGAESDEWSVMSSGWNAPVDNPPMSGTYIAFSIEELSTIEFHDIQTVD